MARSRYVVPTLLAVIGPSLFAAGRQQTPAAPPAPAMRLTSTAFADGADIPAKYTQLENQTSPAVSK